MQRTHRTELPQQEIQDEKAAQQWLDSGIVVRRKTAEFSTGRQYGTLFSTRIIDAGEDWAVEFVIANANFRASVWEETVRAMLPAKHANRIIRVKEPLGGGVEVEVLELGRECTRRQEHQRDHPTGTPIYEATPATQRKFDSISQNIVLGRAVA